MDKSNNYKWYPSVHSDTFSVLQISAAVFLITSAGVFFLLFFFSSFFVNSSNQNIDVILFLITSVTLVIAFLVTRYAVATILYKIRFAKNGISVLTKIYGKEKSFNLLYTDIQFIQVYSRMSTVRHNPKVVIVANGNAKYEVMLKNDEEGDEIMTIVPAELIKKIM